jgi:alkanesulfonate monooxygenase SsuD/methylene tetrahydromethanopterin reductase-like flavin-dependent oxidoreductase (luciferase family)
MPGMKFGAHYLPTYVPDLDGPVAEFYRRMFAQIEEMDRLGFDHAWVTEHHFGEYGGTVPHPPTFLSAVARATRRIRLGVAINALPLHNPLEVAESYAMVDVISNGRLEFGVGKGSEPSEYKRSGVRQEEATARMKEGTEILLQAWSDEPVSFRGEFFQYENVRVLPKPVQRPHPPVWVGCARTEDSFRWAGENGFNLMTLPYLYKTP